MRRRGLAGAAALTLACAVAACGSEDSDSATGNSEDGSAVAALLDRVPGDARQITAMDLAAAKRELRLAADLDPRDSLERPITRTPEKTFEAAALHVLSYRIGVKNTPLAGAIDHGAITASVYVDRPLGGSDLIISRSSQSAASVRRGVEKLNVREVNDDVYVLDKPDELTTLRALAIGDGGLLVLAETPEGAAGVVQRTKPEPQLAPMRRMLDAVRGSLRDVFSNVELSQDEAPCVRRVAGGQRFEPGNPDNDLVLELSTEPRASELTLGTSVSRKVPSFAHYRVSDVARQGQLLKVKVRRLSPGPATHGALTVAELGDLDLLYRCPGAAAAKGRKESQALRDKQLKQAPPDTSGSELETAFSGLIAGTTLAPPPAIKVRCPTESLVRGQRVVRCTGTRRRAGRLYHYKIQVRLSKLGRLEGYDIQTPDDKTGEITNKNGRGSSRRGN